MKIKEVCERTGLTRRAIRFYGEKGLVSPGVDPKEQNDYRDYSEEDVKRLQLIARLRNLRLPVGEVARLLEHPDQASKIMLAHRQAMREEAQACSVLVELLDQLEFTGAQTLSQVAARLDRVGKAAVSPDAEPDFGRLDELTQEERRSLSEIALRTLEKKAAFKKRGLMLGAGIAAVLAVIGIALGGWFYRQRSPLSMASTIGCDICFTQLSGGTFYGEYRVVADFETDRDLATSEKGFTSYRLPLEKSARGDTMAETLVRGHSYAGFSVWVEIPRKEAQSLGLTDASGALDAAKTQEKLFSDSDFAQRYAYISDVFSGDSLQPLP